MGPLARSAAQLRFSGDDLDPVALTGVLGKAPTRAALKGDPRLSVKSGEKVGKFRTGIWSISARERAPADLDAQVAEIFSGMTEDPTVWAQLKKFRPNLFCGLFMETANEGFTVSPSTMKLICDRGIELQLDLYATEEESEVWNA